MAQNKATSSKIPDVQTVTRNRWMNSAARILENWGFDITTDHDPAPLFKDPSKDTTVSTSTITDLLALSIRYRGCGQAVVAALLSHSQERRGRSRTSGQRAMPWITQSDIREARARWGEIEFPLGNYLNALPPFPQAELQDQLSQAARDRLAEWLQHSSLPPATVKHGFDVFNIGLQELIGKLKSDLHLDDDARQIPPISDEGSGTGPREKQSGVDTLGSQEGLGPGAVLPRVEPTLAEGFSAMSVIGVQDDSVQAIDTGSAKEGASFPMLQGNDDSRIVEVPVDIEGGGHENPPVPGRLRILEKLRWEEGGFGIPAEEVATTMAEQEGIQGANGE